MVTRNAEASAAEEDLAMIRGLMERSRKEVTGGTRHYVVWGVLITAALVLTYWKSTQGLGVAYLWIWLVPVALGWGLSLLIARSEEGRAPVRSPAGRMVAGIWWGAGVAMTLIGFLGGAGGALTGPGILGAVACVLGVAQFATSYLVGSRWPRYIALAWWAGGAAIFVWPGESSLLVMAGLMVVLHLVPGLYLELGGEEGAPETGRAT